MLVERIENQRLTDLGVVGWGYARWANPNSENLVFVVVGREHTRWVNYGGIYLCEF